MVPVVQRDDRSKAQCNIATLFKATKVERETSIPQNLRIMYTHKGLFLLYDII